MALHIFTNSDFDLDKPHPTHVGNTLQHVQQWFSRQSVDAQLDRQSLLFRAYMEESLPMLEELVKICGISDPVPVLSQTLASNSVTPHPPPRANCSPVSERPTDSVFKDKIYCFSGFRDAKLE